jgi:hypothetical protein
VFLVVVSVPLGWFAWEMQRARLQREAMEAIVEAGGKAYYDFYPWSPLDILFGPLEPPAQPATSAWLRKLLGDDFFCEVVRVHCRGTEFGDNDARYLKGLTNVECLWLNDTHITDEALGHLQGMTKLQELRLHRTQISDKSIEYLKRITQLESLWVGETKVTEQGISELRQALPNCHISTAPPPYPYP